MKYSESNISKKEELWIYDPEVLIREENYKKFYPVYNSSREEQLNAITRFLFYFIIIMIITNRNKNMIYLSTSIIILIIIVYVIDNNDNNNGKKKLDRIMKIRKEEKDNNRFDDKHDNQKYEEYRKNKENEENTKLYKYIYNNDENEKYKNNKCKKPTYENPFMNTIYNNEKNEPVACNSDDEDINDEMRMQYNKNLFQNIDDLWENKNSQRQFYTLPNTRVPNNQIDFAKWLYKVPKTCKEDQYKCLDYEPLYLRNI